MFVLSKWQCVALTTCWRASVRALFNSFPTFLDQTTNISRKVRAPRRVSASGASNDVPNCHLDKTNMDNSSMHRDGITSLQKTNLSRRMSRTPVTPMAKVSMEESRKHHHFRSRRHSSSSGIRLCRGIMYAHSRDYSILVHNARSCIFEIHGTM